MMVEQVSDFKMPEKIVTRLIKEALPEDVILSKDAKNAACRFAGIFLLQLSMAAAEKAQMAKRRTLDNQDILKAMTELGLSECVPQLVRFGARKLSLKGGYCNLNVFTFLFDTNPLSKLLDIFQRENEMPKGKSLT